MSTVPFRKGKRAAPVDDEALPPQNLEAERGVLGGLLLDPDPLAEVAARLRPDDFFRDAHGVVFSAMLALRAAGTPVDAITLTEALRGGGDYERIGGDGLIDALLNGVPHAANTVYYAQIVAEKARTRALAEAARALAERCYSGQLACDDLVAGAYEELGRVAARARAGDDLEAVCLADVQPEPIRWLWPGRIPVGMLTLLCGDPGLGKSFVTLAIAAAVTTGAPWPDARGECAEVGSVVLIAAEDSLAQTVRPRLDAAGADVTRVHAIAGRKLPDGSLSPFSLVRDLGRLDRMADRLADLRLVVIDPVTAYLGSKAEHESRNAEIRTILTPLGQWAERRGVGVVLVTHLNKGGGTKAVYRSTGSLAFIAASRISWMFVKDPKDRLRRKLLPAKPNIVAEPTGLAYRIVEGAVAWEPTPLDEHADDALAEEAAARKPGEPKRGPLPARTQAAAEWLVGVLSAMPGGGRCGPLQRGAAEAGHAQATFYEALNRLRADGVVEEFHRPDERGKFLRLVGLEPAPHGAAHAEGNGNGHPDHGAIDWKAF